MKYAAVHVSSTGVVLFDRSNLVPPHWLRCLALIGEADSDSNEMKKKGEMSVSKIKELGKLCGVSSSDEIGHMLDAFHALGFVFHFKRTDEIVYTNPQLLVEELSKVLMTSTTKTVCQEKELERCGLVADYALLKSNATVTRDLLEFMWGKERFHFLLDFMKSNFLLAGHGDVEPKYFIPSLMMTKVNPPQVIGPRLKFLNVPLTVYHRLICLCISHSSSTVEPQLSRLEGRFDVGYTFTLSSNDVEETLTLQVESPAEAVCLELVVVMLHKIRFYDIELEIPKHGKLSFANGRKERIKPWFRLVRRASILPETPIVEM